MSYFPCHHLQVAGNAGLLMFLASRFLLGTMKLLAPSPPCLLGEQKGLWSKCPSFVFMWLHQLCLYHAFPSSRMVYEVFLGIRHFFSPK